MRENMVASGQVGEPREISHLTRTRPRQKPTETVGVPPRVRPDRTHTTSRGSMRRSLYFAGALALSAGVLQGQVSTRSRSRSDDGPVRVYSFDSGRSDDRDRAAIGITTSSGGMRDTLG